MSQILLPSEKARLAAAKTASRYHLPGKAPGTTIEFGIDRVFGRFFQFWPDMEEPSIDEDHLGQGEMVALLKRYGKPSSQLDKTVEAIMLDMEPKALGVRAIQGRFLEGPEGQKQFKEWLAKQPQETQDSWQEMNDKYGDVVKDQHKTATPSYVDSTVRDSLLPVEAAKLATPSYVDDTVLENEISEESMFAQGEKVPLKDLPQELQDNVTDPPPAVEKLKQEMQEESMMEKEGPPMLPVEMARMASEKSGRERLSWEKEAATGLYGFTKQTQSDVEASVRKIQKRALSLAKQAYAKDAGVVPFLQVHAKRARSSSAQLVLAAMKDIGPKVASDETVKEASDKTAKGLYGHPAKTARLGLSVCADFRAFAGEVAADLHTRRTARYAKITGFLGQHSKQGKCAYSKLLLGCYPDGPEGKTAARSKPGVWSYDPRRKKLVEFFSPMEDEDGPEMAYQDLPRGLIVVGVYPGGDFSELERDGMVKRNGVEGKTASARLPRRGLERLLDRTVADYLEYAEPNDVVDSQVDFIDALDMAEDLAREKHERRASDKDAGCEKLPEGGMRENCEKKKEEGEGKKKDDGDKKAADFDPEEIGQPEKGPLEGDPDEKSMMDGHFTQKDQSELSEVEKTAKGQAQEIGETVKGPLEGDGAPKGHFTQEDNSNVADALSKKAAPSTVKGWLEWAE